MSKKLKRVMCLVLALCLTMTLFLGTSEEVQAADYVKTFKKTLTLKAYQEVQVNLDLKSTVVMVLTRKDKGNIEAQFWNGYDSQEMFGDGKKMKIQGTTQSTGVVIHNLSGKEVTYKLKVVSKSKAIKYKNIEDHGCDESVG